MASTTVLTLTSRQISRCFSAKCIAWSWFPSAVCAFPRLQHARPSPILQRNKNHRQPGVSIHAAWDQRVQSPPVVQVLGDDEMLEVVVDGSLVVLQECVGVAQTVAGLSLHRSVLQLPGQLQRPPAGRRNTLPLSKLSQPPLTGTLHWEELTCSVRPPLQSPPRRCTCCPGCSRRVSLPHGRQIPWL